MKPNPVKQALKAGKVQLGCGYWQLGTPEVARILAAGGFDWGFFDGEHGNFGFESMQQICRAGWLAGITPIARVGELQYTLVARSLDAGAMGILFPRVEDPKLLEQAISWAKFPPLGIRGFGLATMHVYYENMTMQQIIDYYNENILVVMQIETQRALDAREELLSVPGIDAVMVGPADLSISLGVPGDFMHPRMIAAMEAIVETCQKKGIAPGTQTRNMPLAKFWREKGMLFLGCSNETSMLLEKAQEITAALR